MRLIFTGLVLLTLISFSPVLGKTDSCLDSFRDFDPIEAKIISTTQDVDYDSEAAITWYGKCILVGSTKGLLLYDISQPNAPIVLAHVDAKAITNMAANPQNMTIAFNVAQDENRQTVEGIKKITKGVVGQWNAIAQK